jgi:protein O-mannosyl-transferase
VRELSPEAARSRRRSIRLAAAGAGVLGLLLYLNTASNAFVFDDVDVVLKNPLAHDPSAVRAIFGSHYWANVQSSGNLYRPLTIWSFALNSALTGSGPAGFHVANALLHGIVSALVALLAGALGMGGGGALAAGALFAAHPIHVEAVAPIVGRSELLAALFGLAAWLCHLGGSARPEDSHLSPFGRYARLAAAPILFAAALLSKENAAVLPSLILAGDLVLRGGRGLRGARLASLVVMGATLLTWLALRSAVVPGLSPDDPSASVFGGVDPVMRILTAVGVLGRYLWLMALPWRLSADYSFHQIPLIASPFDALFILSAAAHAGLAAAGFVLARRGRLSGLAILVYLGALFPASNLPFSIGTVMAERLLYLPSAGLCLLAPALYAELSWGREGAGRRRAAASALALVCGLYAARTVSRNLDWRDAMTLYSATVQASPQSAKAHYNLGAAQDERGDRAGAMASYRRAIEIKPDMAEAERNYGLDLLQGGDAAGAYMQLSAAAKIDPGIPDVFNDLGLALRMLGRSSEADAAFRSEMRLRPEGSRAPYNLGELLLQEGRVKESLDLLRRAATLDPHDADARAQMGFAFEALGRHAEAASAFGEALRLDAGMRDVYIPLARALLSAGDEAGASRIVAQARSAGIAVPEDLLPGGK